MMVSESMREDQTSPIGRAMLRAGLNAGTDPATLEGDDLIDFFVEASKVKTELDDELKMIKAGIGDVEEAVVEQFMERGTSKVTRRGLTVHLSRESWPKMLEGVDRSDVIDALQDNPDTAHLVTESYNSQSLRSVMTKVWQDEETGEIAIPEDLAGVIEASTKVRAKTRKS